MLVSDTEQLADPIDLTTPPTIDLSTPQPIAIHRQTLQPLKSRGEIEICDA